ncbi:MAG: hypothetical protein IPP71_15335 [Bacteroidetes bacterium]|nr:hypothetical protein [Bacteroidota bacterium]
MHPSLKFSALILVLSTLIAACSLRNQVSVVERNFGEEIETVQNLIFKFDHDLAPDSILNLWDSTGYIEFNPAVKGSFKWNSARELVFSPNGAFNPATAYTATLNNDLLKFAGSELTLNTKENKFKFHTPFLQSLSNMSWWTMSQEEPGMVNLNISFTFNYHIDPAVIAKIIELKINGKLSDFRIADNAISQTLTLVSSALPKDLIGGCTLEFSISKGAICQSCELGTPESLTGKQEIQAPDKLEITHVEGVLESGGGSILIYCNQEVLTKDLSKYIKISPAVNFTVEPNGNGISINGNYEAGASYQIDISKELTGAFGGTLEKDYTALVPFGEMEPSIGFVSNKGIYMSTASSRKIALHIVNIPNVNVKIFKIYENNIIAFMRYHRYNDYWGEEETESFGYNDYNIDNLGDVIMDQEYETKNLIKNNGVRLLNLDFNEQNQFRGIYLVTVSSTEERWRKVHKMISISDIGLIARQTNDEIFVFTNSIKDAQAMKGVKITFISTNNQVLGTETTNSSGVADLKFLKSKHPGFKIGMITARAGNDFNYMTFADSRVEDSRFDVGGKTDNPSGYEAYLYCDREIYRPGEKVYFNTIIRTSSLDNLIQVPVKVKVLMPNGRAYTSMKKTLNTQGASEGFFQLGTTSVTGTYTIEVYSANDILLASKNISVEEFIPDRISVATQTNKSEYTVGDSLLCEATAMNLFGTPAVQRNYEMEFSLRKTPIYSKKYHDYNFDLSGADNITFSTVLRQGKRMLQGKQKKCFLLVRDFKYRIVKWKIYVTVLMKPADRLTEQMNSLLVRRRPITV